MIRVLSDYEALLKDQIARVAILGEIDISESEWRDLGELIALRVRRRGFTAATAELERDAPTALAVIDEWSEQQDSTGGSEESGPGLVSRTANALLGVRL